MDIDRFSDILDDIVREVPEEFMRGLNGGIMVVPEAKKHPGEPHGRLYILGEYCVQIPGLGRYVAIYHGSFEKLYGGITHGRDRVWREEARKTLLHELTHHWESLAGEKDLEIEDARRLREYRERYHYDEP